MTNEMNKKTTQSSTETFTKVDKETYNELKKISQRANIPVKNLLKEAILNYISSVNKAGHIITKLPSTHESDILAAQKKQDAEDPRMADPEFARHRRLIRKYRDLGPAEISRRFAAGEDVPDAATA